MLGAYDEPDTCDSKPPVSASKCALVALLRGRGRCVVHGTQRVREFLISRARPQAFSGESKSSAKLLKDKNVFARDPEGGPLHSLAEDKQRKIVAEDKKVALKSCFAWNDGSTLHSRPLCC